MIFLCNLCCVPQKRTTSSLATKSIFFFLVRIQFVLKAAALQRPRKRENLSKLSFAAMKTSSFQSTSPYKFIYPKYNKNSNESRNFLFLGRLGRQGISENFCKFAKVSYFGGRSFSCFHEQNVCKFFFVDCSIRTKRLIDINVKKVPIFVLKCTFLDQNRL